jgi:hypothetical protein
MKQASTQTAASAAYRPWLARRWLWFVSGADARVLRDMRCPESERTKFDSIGAAMCLTTGLAFLAGWSAFYQIFFPGLHRYELVGTPWRATTSLLFALIWTLVIFNMQRFIMSSSRRVSNHGTLKLVDLLHTVPGALLSMSVALTVATPLQVLLLAPEIDVQLLKERQAQKSVVHADIESRYESETLELAEAALLLRERGGPDPLSGRTAPTCLTMPTTAAEAPLESQSGTCLQAVEQWYAGVARRMAAWTQGHPAQGDHSADDRDADWLALRNEWLQARKARERMFADMTSDQGNGLIRRTAIAYAVNPLSTWGLLLVLCFIQGVPVMIRAISPKGPYDDLLDMVGRQHLAAAGIEPQALYLFDRAGTSYPVDLYRMAKEKEHQSLSVLWAERHRLRNRRLAHFERRHAAILKKAKTCTGGPADPSA